MLFELLHDEQGRQGELSILWNLEGHSSHGTYPLSVAVCGNGGPQKTPRSISEGSHVEIDRGVFVDVRLVLRLLEAGDVVLGSHVGVARGHAALAGRVRVDISC